MKNKISNNFSFDNRSKNLNLKKAQRKLKN